MSAYYDYAPFWFVHLQYTYRLRSEVFKEEREAGFIYRLECDACKSGT